MTGAARRGFVPIGGLHHAARDTRRGLLRVQRLRRRDRAAAQAAWARSASPTSTSMRIMATACSTRSKTTRTSSSRTCTRTGASSIPAPGAAEETGKGAAAGTKLNIPLPPGADDAVFARAWPQGDRAPRALRAGVHHSPVRRGQPRGRPHHAPALTRRPSHGRAALELCALADRLGHGRVLALGGGGYNRAISRRPGRASSRAFADAA